MPVANPESEICVAILPPPCISKWTNSFIKVPPFAILGNLVYKNVAWFTKAPPWAGVSETILINPDLWVVVSTVTGLWIVISLPLVRVPL